MEIITKIIFLASVSEFVVLLPDLKGIIIHDKI